MQPLLEISDMHMHAAVVDNVSGAEGLIGQCYKQQDKAVAGVVAV